MFSSIKKHFTDYWKNWKTDNYFWKNEKKVNVVDIVVGLAWGDEAKGKISAALANKTILDDSGCPIFKIYKFILLCLITLFNYLSVFELLSGRAFLNKIHQELHTRLSRGKKYYDFVCRWSGSSNAGHTIYIGEKQYKTHLIPSGVFHGINSVIGPDCYVNIQKFLNEIQYLQENRFDTSLIKISPYCHIITEEHRTEDQGGFHSKKQGSTGSGVAPCARDKFNRSGLRLIDTIQKNEETGEIIFKGKLNEFWWDGELWGNVLCEGAQGFNLDINNENYPYVTSSNTLPTQATTLGFDHRKIRDIYGAIKLYDTRSGNDPDFPEELFEDKYLDLLCSNGKELGVTTGRKRKCNYLNMKKLIRAIKITGANKIVFSKCDIIEKCNKKYYNNNRQILKVYEDYDSNNISNNLMYNIYAKDFKKLIKQFNKYFREQLDDSNINFVDTIYYSKSKKQFNDYLKF